jgi:hypothetical protein
LAMETGLLWPTSCKCSSSSSSSPLLVPCIPSRLRLNPFSSGIGMFCTVPVLYRREGEKNNAYLLPINFHSSLVSVADKGKNLNLWLWYGVAQMIVRRPARRQGPVRILLRYPIKVLPTKTETTMNGDGLWRRRMDYCAICLTV